jgi:outer membrane protein OmpA-like peptidoglycan-associated protein
MTRTGALLVGLVVGGCSSSMPQTKMVAVQPAAEHVACAADVDCGSQQLCVERACYDVSSTMACAERPIHFVTNSAAIDTRNRPELNQLAACLRADKNVRVSVSGNADERGDRDYNRGLAQRRADAVAGYLEATGVSKQQLTTIGYGVDRPLCNEHDAQCWRQNRRVDVAATGNDAPSTKNKQTSDDDTKGSQRIDGTGNGTDNGSPLGK